jgi:nuclease-like protein
MLPGVYAVETKTRSKPTKTRPEVFVENDRLTVAGYPLDRDPMMQARACANDLRHVLQTSTGRSFNVQPVVVFPGWYIEDKRGQKSSVWVLEPKGLPAWIKRDPQTIRESDVSMATYHLSRYIRTFVR